MTLGESVGFAVPAAVGASLADTPAFLPLLLVAGAVEGAVLGLAQLDTLRRLMPRIRGWAWTGLTATGAVAAYALGMLPSTLAPMWMTWSWPARGLFFLLLGTLLLATIGGCQWVELRRHVRGAGWWVVGTACAWLIGLAIFLTIATALWHDGQSRSAAIAIGVGTGVLMATAMATVTGLTLVEILRREARRVARAG